MKGEKRRKGKMKENDAAKKTKEARETRVYHLLFPSFSFSLLSTQTHTHISKLFFLHQCTVDENDGDEKRLPIYDRPRLAGEEEREGGGRESMAATTEASKEKEEKE